jgi:hypothetical protein
MGVALGWHLVGVRVCAGGCWRDAGAGGGLGWDGAGGAGGERGGRERARWGSARTDDVGERWGLGAGRDTKRVRRWRGRNGRDATGACDRSNSRGLAGAVQTGVARVVSALSHGPTIRAACPAPGAGPDGDHSCSDTRARNRTRFANVSLGTDDATRRRPPAPGAIRREGGEAPNACQTPPIAHPAGRQERWQRTCQ